MIYSIFNKTTGNLARTVHCDSSLIDINTQENEIAIEGAFSNHYLDAENQLQPISEIPPYCHWQPETRTVSEPDIAALHADAARMIDDASAAIYSRFTRFDQEYVAREAQALAYRDAGYTGDVPRQVAAFAVPAGITAQQAADTILQQAATLRAAIEQLGVLRMRKYEVYAQPTAEDKIAHRDAILQAIHAFGGQLS